MSNIHFIIERTYTDESGGELWDGRFVNAEGDVVALVKRTVPLDPEVVEIHPF